MYTNFLLALKQWTDESTNISSFCYLAKVPLSVKMEFATILLLSFK